MRVLDYSAGYPGAAAIKKAGFVGAARYIGLPGYTKCATKAELDDFTAHGLGMALVFEHFATDWRGGYQAGRANMRRALDHAYAIGWKADGRPIYMAVDQDVVTPGEFDAAMEYLDGAGDAHQGPGSTGPYGEHDVCARSAVAGFAWQWQCRAWSGVPTPKLFGGRRLYQHYGNPDGGPNPVVGGVECDVNDALVDDWGQHNAEDQMQSDERNAVISTHAALFQRIDEGGNLVLEFPNPGDQSIIGRLVELQQNVRALVARPVADIDEAELAAELEKLGVGGVNAAQVKQAVIEVLRGGTEQVQR